MKNKVPPSDAHQQQQHQQNRLGNEPINPTTPTTHKIVSFLGSGSKKQFNPMKASSQQAPPLNRLQKIVLNIGKLWNDSFGRRVLTFTALFLTSAYFVAVPKFNKYIKDSQQEDDDEEDDEE